MSATFNPDGYTRNGYVAAVHNLHGAVSFTYRPTTYEERQQQLHKSDRDTPKQIVDKTVALLANKVKSWDIAHPETGDAVPIDGHHLRRVPTAILLKMECIVLGLTPSDDDPEALNGAEQSAADAKN